MKELMILPTVKKQVFEAPVLQLQVVDGDTLDLLLDVGFGGRIQVRGRLLGLDAPESSTHAGQLVTEVVYKWIQGCERLRWRSKRMDKYGRSLGELWGVTSLNECLLTAGFAKPYDGDGPRVWTADELNAIVSLLP